MQLQQQDILNPDRGAVLTKAVLNGAERLGLNARMLGEVLGLSEATVSRMKAGRFQVSEGSKAYELAALLVRVFRSLDAIAGGDTGVVKGWMAGHNTVLDARPVDRVVTVSGLTEVLAYLDARRATL